MIAPDASSRRGGPDAAGHRWARGRAELVRFIEIHGHPHVRRDFVSPSGFPLGTWVHTQRNRRRRGLLNDQRVQSLTALGLNWAPGRGEQWWVEGLKALQEYVAAHGHARVPHDFRTTGGLALGTWVVRRRHDRRRGRLDAAKIQALDDLGFVWHALAYPDSWERGIDELRQYRDEHGTPEVPRECTTSTGFPLGSWLRRRRYEYRAGHLKPGQAATLAKLGVSWQLRDPDARWHRALSALQRYRDTYANTLVPRWYVDQDEFPLGRWVSEMRQRKRQGRLPAQRIATLEALDFVWNIRPPRPHAHKTTSREATYARWVADLYEFVQSNGHADVPHAYVTATGRRLGSWLRNQRVAFGEGRLPAERRAALENLGVRWSLRARSHKDP